MTGGQVIEVANYDRWPGYRGGQLYSFHCKIRISRYGMTLSVGCWYYMPAPDRLCCNYCMITEYV
jgi:hypothetical protein